MLLRRKLPLLRVFGFGLCIFVVPPKDVHSFLSEPHARFLRSTSPYPPLFISRVGQTVTLASAVRSLLCAAHPCATLRFSFDPSRVLSSRPLNSRSLQKPGNHLQKRRLSSAAPRPFCISPPLLPPIIVSRKAPLQALCQRLSPFYLPEIFAIGPALNCLARDQIHESIALPCPRSWTMAPLGDDISPPETCPPCRPPKPPKIALSARDGQCRNRPCLRPRPVLRPHGRRSPLSRVERTAPASPRRWRSGNLR